MSKFNRCLTIKSDLKSKSLIYKKRYELESNLVDNSSERIPSSPYQVNNSSLLLTSSWKREKQNRSQLIESLIVGDRELSPRKPTVRRRGLFARLCSSREQDSITDFKTVWTFLSTIPSSDATSCLTLEKSIRKPIPGFAFVAINLYAVEAFIFAHFSFLVLNEVCISSFVEGWLRERRGWSLLSTFAGVVVKTSIILFI